MQVTPVPENRIFSCSLNWSLIHQPDSPMQNLSQLKGMQYTAHVLHVQYFLTCFMLQILLFVPSSTTLFQHNPALHSARPASVLSAEQTSLALILATTFLNLSDMPCTYGVTTRLQSKCETDFTASHMRHYTELRESMRKSMQPWQGRGGVGGWTREYLFQSAQH